MVNSGKLTNYDEDFVKQFLVNGNVSLPKESMLLATGDSCSLTFKKLCLQNNFRINQGFVQFPKGKQDLLLQH